MGRSEEPHGAEAAGKEEGEQVEERDVSLQEGDAQVGLVKLATNTQVNEVSFSDGPHESRAENASSLRDLRARSEQKNDACPPEKAECSGRTSSPANSDEEVSRTSAECRTAEQRKNDSERTAGYAGDQSTAVLGSAGGAGARPNGLEKAALQSPSVEATRRNEDMPCSWSTAGPNENMQVEQAEEQDEEAEGRGEDEA
eukprot:2659391-Rhodomonas_salina.1